NGDARQPELLHGARGAHDRREDVAHVRGLHVAEGEPRVAERREPRLARHVGVRLLGPHAEAMHADAEDGDGLHRPPSTCPKPTMTTSWWPSSGSGSSQAPDVGPTR